MNIVHLQEIDRNKPINFDSDSLNESDILFHANVSRKIEKYNEELDEEHIDEIDPEEELNFNH